MSLKLKLNNKVFEASEAKFGEIILPVDDEFDILFFHKWQNQAIGEGGRIPPRKLDYARDVEFIKITERGTLKGCFALLSENEDYVKIVYDVKVLI